MSAVLVNAGIPWQSGVTEVSCSCDEEVRFVDKGTTELSIFVLLRNCHKPFASALAPLCALDATVQLYVLVDIILISELAPVCFNLGALRIGLAPLRRGSECRLIGMRRDITAHARIDVGIPNATLWGLSGYEFATKG